MHVCPAPDRQTCWFCFLGAHPCWTLNLIVISIRHLPLEATPIIPYPDFKVSERLFIVPLEVYASTPL